MAGCCPLGVARWVEARQPTPMNRPSVMFSSHYTSEQSKHFCISSATLNTHITNKKQNKRKILITTTSTEAAAAAATEINNKSWGIFPLPLSLSLLFFFLFWSTFFYWIFLLTLCYGHGLLIFIELDAKLRYWSRWRINNNWRATLAAILRLFDYDSESCRSQAFPLCC